MGGIDDSRPEAQGGYDPGVRSCWDTWHKAYPQIPKGNMNDFIEEQGPVQGWCQEIRLFAQAATMAGPHLDRRTFVEAMSKIKNYPRRLLADPHLRAGQVLRAHRVRGGEPAQQCPPVESVPAAGGHLAPARSLLAHRPDLEGPSRELVTVNLSSAKTQWEEEGWCLVEGLFSPEEVRAAQAVMPDLFPTAEEFAADVDPERNLPFRVDSHSVMPTFPFESSALNRLVLHDKVIDLAQDFLGLPDVRLYQGMLSAKYSNGAPDDEQLLHVDYGNHTLVVPRPEVGYQHLELFIYLSDVTPETAATRMVSRHLTIDIPTERTYLSPTEYDHLYRAEVPASGPAGSVLAYRPDVYHRGRADDAPPTRPASCCTSRSSPRTRTGSVPKPGPVRPKAWPGTASCSGPTCGNSPCWVFPNRATVLDRGDPARGGGALPAARHGTVAEGAT